MRHHSLTSSSPALLEPFLLRLLFFLYSHSLSYCVYIVLLILQQRLIVLLTLFPFRLEYSACLAGEMPDPASSPSHHPLGGTKPEPDCKESEDIMVLQSVPPSLLSALDSSSMENLFDKAMEDSKPFGVEERSDSGTMMPDDFRLPPSSLPQAALYYNVAEV
jgi:hypothetical protein